MVVGWAVQTIALFFPGRADFKRGRYVFSPVRQAGFTLAIEP